MADCGSTVWESFSYDGASNVRSRIGTAATHRSDGTRGFTWWAADRLVQRGADTFGYDALGRMTSRARPAPTPATATGCSAPERIHGVRSVRRSGSVRDSERWWSASALC